MRLVRAGEVRFRLAEQSQVRERVTLAEFLLTAVRDELGQCKAADRLEESKPDGSPIETGVAGHEALISKPADPVEDVVEPAG